MGTEGEPGFEEWNAAAIRGLRRSLGLSQQAMAAELGVRQQTISEWEVGIYEPRGASRRLLSIVAEQAAPYFAGPPGQRPPPSPKRRTRRT